MIEEKIDMLIEMYQGQLNGANEHVKENIRALTKADQDELHCYIEKKDYLGILTKEINDTEQKVSMMKEFLDHLKWIKEETSTNINNLFFSEWTPFEITNDGFFVSMIPDADEEILVSDGNKVWLDTWVVENVNTTGLFGGYAEFENYTGLDSGESLDGLAWMSLPEPHGDAQ